MDNKKENTSFIPFVESTKRRKLAARMPEINVQIRNMVFYTNKLMEQINSSGTPEGEDLLNMLKEIHKILEGPMEMEPKLASFGSLFQSFVYVLNKVDPAISREWRETAQKIFLSFAQIAKMLEDKYLSEAAIQINEYL